MDPDLSDEAFTTTSFNEHPSEDNSREHVSGAEADVSDCFYNYTIKEIAGTYVGTGGFGAGT